MKTIIEDRREIPVIGEYDTVVAGGGIAGVAAALGAARNGAKTLLLESQYMLGGLATAGLITYYLPLCDGMGTQVSYGLAEELLKLSVGFGEQNDYPDAWLNGNDPENRKKHRYSTQFDANVFAILLEELLIKEGVEILYGTLVCGIQKNGTHIESVIVENKSGRGAILSGTVVDATGDAAVCHLCGEETALYGDKNKIAAWYYEFADGKYELHCLGARDSVDEGEGNKILGLFDGVDAKELSDVTLISHKVILDDFLKRGKVGRNHAVATIATTPQVRMNRRLCGQKSISVSDERKSFHDSIGMFASWRKKDVVFEVPFGCLIGRKTSNLIVAGRCISVENDLWDLSRVIPVCAVTGEAAGIACTLTDNFFEINVSELQNKIRRRGGKIHFGEVYKNT